MKLEKKELPLLINLDLNITFFFPFAFILRHLETTDDIKYLVLSLPRLSFQFKQNLFITLKKISRLVDYIINEIFNCSH